ncbi:MAG: toprim domain-containing protein [Dysgonomonas sp.]|uniref:toprim domain-containing protein n=1 Tax=Dysgonomonas sp. TaxID=1891233 RepID=UPI00257D628C|nr:toprim domain-containing protein [Dysgonomonas sp.]MBS7121606.1 toprim domain-containing protein [Dysgonomonas sp.]
MTTYNEANKISIKAYLASKDIYPVKDHGYYGMYRSPFRNDINASLKVDYNKNLWIDFGSNDGGTMIDLVMRINNCSLNEAMQELNLYNSTSVNLHNNTTVEQKSDSFSFHGNNSNKNTPAITIQKVFPITHQALIDYLSERKISLDIARQYCSEIHYSVNGKPFFAIGFPNDSKGWILRSGPFKGCTSMDVTTYNGANNTNNTKESCLVFEGFTDFLSYLTLKDIHTPEEDVIVLNSLSNLSKAIDKLKSYKEIHTYLDNDDPGKKATLSIKQSYPNTVDQSAKYADYKDLNEYLVSTRQIQGKEKPKVEVKRKPFKGFRP